MRFTALVLVLCSCAAAPLRIASTPTQLDAKTLAGTWHVVASNFPLWTKGTKTNPTFNYGVLGEGRLSDTVRYLEDGKPDHIEGIDRQDAEVPTHFTWRGLGLLALFTSEWDVVAIDADAGWAVISFSSTLATPEGVDVICRDRSPAPGVLQAALDIIASDPVLSARAVGLVKLTAP